MIVVSTKVARWGRAGRGTRMRVCYIHIYIYTYMYMCICVYVYLFLSLSLYIYIYTHAHTLRAMFGGFYELRRAISISQNCLKG